MTARLPQAHEHRQHGNPISPARGFSGKFAHLLSSFLQNLAVHPLLLIRKLAVGDLLDLRGQILGHLRFGSA